MLPRVGKVRAGSASLMGDGVVGRWGLGGAGWDWVGSHVSRAVLSETDSPRRQRASCRAPAGRAVSTRAFGQTDGVGRGGGGLSARAAHARDRVGPAKERGERVRAWSGAECWVLSGWSRRAAYPKWPCPGTRFMKLLVNGSYRRCGPMKHVALLVEPCEMKSWFSAQANGAVGGQQLGGWGGVKRWVCGAMAAQTGGLHVLRTSKRRE